MRILILGGGVFVGRQILLESVRRGHHVTAFTRGRHLGIIPGGVESVVGDRRHDLSVLARRHWDAVVDTSGYRPSDVRSSAVAFRSVADRYAFISTLDVYPDHSISGLAESAPTEAGWDATLDPKTRTGYRLLKSACEREVQAVFPAAHLIFRTGLVVGPRDPTGRFSYWPLRLRHDADVLAPAPQTAPLQFIDVRDHAQFVVDLLEAKATGIYNTTSPPGAYTFGDVLRTCASLVNASPRVVWVDDALLAEHRIRPWTELPLWPGRDKSRTATMLIDTAKAQLAGLTVRPVVDTVRDILRGEAGSDHIPTRAGKLSSLRERMLILIAREEGFVVDETQHKTCRGAG